MPRFTKRINITISPSLLKRLDAATSNAGATRSGLIHEAIYDWLEKHAVKSQPGKQSSNHSGTIYEPEKYAFNHYVKRGMTADQLLQTLEEYEAVLYNRV
jgi:metal-responsive CopG/Arc/MetJ family transcriptional regulator